MHTDPQTLICPACRRPPEAWPIDRETLTCTSSSCGRAYPLLDNRIPIVVPGEFDEVHDADVLPALESADLMDRVNELELGSDPWKRVVMASMYVESHFGGLDQPFSALCEQLLPTDEHIKTAVDLGCGVGRMAIEVAHRTGTQVLALDANPLALRWAARAADGATFDVPVLATVKRFERTAMQSPTNPAPGSVHWVCGDVFNPPFVAEAFDLATVVSLIDTVSDPFIAFGQACALVKRGGYLLLAQPDTWDPAVTPPENWLADDSRGWDEMLARFGFRTVKRVDSVMWELHRTPRQHFRYVLHGCLAKKER